MVKVVSGEIQFWFQIWCLRVQLSVYTWDKTLIRKVVTGKIFLFYLLHISLGYSKEADTVMVPDEKYQVDAEVGIFDIRATRQESSEALTYWAARLPITL